MKYYLITIVNNKHKVIRTTAHIAYARKHARSEIDFNNKVFGWSDGVSICTDKAIKSYICEDKRELKYESGAKLRFELETAIKEYKEGAV